MFHELAPWKWMLEMDLFGVAHPVNGEIGYCSILGPQQELEGLAVYKGMHGLNSYEHLFDGEYDMPSLSVLYEQDCMVMLFLEEEDLFEEEKQILAKYNRAGSFNGRYPVFRDYSPGWVVWTITDSYQAIWMEVALQQALEVARRFRDDADLLDHVSNNEAHVLVRKPMNPPFLDEWYDDWVPLEAQEEQSNLNKELFVRSNCSHLPRRDRDWFATLFYLSSPIEYETTRPYLPLMVILADYLLGDVLYDKQFRPGEEEHYIQYAFVQTCKRQNYLPKRLIIGESRDYDRWETIGKILGIPVELEANSSLSEELKQDYLS
ncbi:MAG: hypothetical protein MRZ79_13085 [Bacteroidia bacterium]|nr:hypothetical protein [Bacteroidia bacterium]